MSSHTLTPRKSEGDTRAYRVVTLSNGLVATLVQDTNTDKAAVAMDVGVGHFSDPEELPGLAHFLEVSSRQNLAHHKFSAHFFFCPFSSTCCS